MKKVCINQAGGEFFEKVCAMPSVSGFDIVIEVKAGSINPVDTKIRATYAGTDSKVLGYDCSGAVIAVGELVSTCAEGDSVYCAGVISRDGSNASYQIVDSRIVAPMPRSLSFEQAAAFPLVTLTAYETLFDRMHISPESTDTVLIINGAGGVGSLAIQLLKAKTKCRVIATASRPESASWCRELGTDLILDHRQPLKQQLQGNGVEAVRYIFNAADSTDYLATMAECVAPQGTIACLVDFREPVDMNLFKRKSVTFVWEFMFTRPLFSTIDLLRQHEILAELAKLIESGTIRPVDRHSLGRLSAETIAEGHRLIATGTTIGKITWTI